jgi:hypothetical protein
VFFVLGEVLSWGNICFVFGSPFKGTSVSPLSYPLPDLEETVEADESVRDRASSSLLPHFDFKMLEDSFFLLGKMVRVAVLDCGLESDSASQSCTLSRLLASWREDLSLKEVGVTVSMWMPDLFVIWGGGMLKLTQD